MSLDETMSDSQQSQFMREKFPPQGRRISIHGQSTQLATSDEDLKTAIEDLLTQLIAKNKAEEEDTGIHNILEALGKANPEKFIKGKFLRNELVAGLGFLNDIGFNEDKNLYKGIKVEDFIPSIIK